MQRLLMLNPGPTNVHDDVRRAANTADTNHRETSFAEVLWSVRLAITDRMGLSATHTCIPFVASGTGVNEAVLANVPGPVAVLVTGRYSERLAGICDVMGIPVLRLVCDPLREIDLDAMNSALAKRCDLTTLCAVHHETASAAVLPLDQIATIAEARGLRLMVDGISSIFGQDLGLRRSQVDYFTLTANKCLESIPGLSFVIARRSLVEAAGSPSRSYYFDLHRQYVHMELAGAPLFTQPYSSYCAANTALQRLTLETVEGRITRYRRLRERLRIGLAPLGIEAFRLPQERQANWLQLYAKPADLDFRILRDRLMRHGMAIYSDAETLAKGYMYFATMGAIDESDIDRFIDAVGIELPFVLEARNHLTESAITPQEIEA